jgi:hypothetical protein
MKTRVNLALISNNVSETELCLRPQEEIWAQSMDIFWRYGQYVLGSTEETLYLRTEEGAKLRTVVLNKNQNNG